MGICCMAQETQTGVLYQPKGMGCGGRWEEDSKGRAYIYIPMAVSCWGLTKKQQNSVKQLSFNEKILKEERKKEIDPPFWVPPGQWSLESIILSPHKDLANWELWLSSLKLQNWVKSHKNHHLSTISHHPITSKGNEMGAFKTVPLGLPRYLSGKESAWMQET